MMNNFFYAYQCNDLYGEGAIDGVRYGMIEAVDMSDARRCLGNSRFPKVNGARLNARNFRKINFRDGEIAAEYPRLCQRARKAIYDGVRSENTLDLLLPGWRLIG